jgi:hypothetical protein
VAKTLRSVPLLGSSNHAVTASPLSGVIAFTDWCAFSPFRAHARSRVATVRERCPPTSRLFSTEESVAMRATLPRRARSMLPWALDRLVPMAAALLARCPARAGHFAWRPEPRWRPPTRTSGEGRVFRPCLAPATRCHNRPRREIAAGRRGSGNSRRSRLGRTPSCLTECQWIRPERKVHRVGPVTRRCWVADVIATHLRRDSFATQCSLRRAATGGSSSCSPSFRGCPRT